MNDFDIVVKYTNEVSEVEKETYCRVFCQVYGERPNMDWHYEKKYSKNPYGDSLIVFCYDEEVCVAIQAFMRNDLNGRMAFESGDSATISSHRGKGIFSSLVRAGVAALPKEAIVYGFPNDNSLPAFRKLGWHIGEREKSTFFKNEYLSDKDFIDQKYLEWMLDGKNEFYYYNRQGQCLLLEYKKANIYQVIGYGNANAIMSIPGIQKARFPILFIHHISGTIGTGMLAISLKEEHLPMIPIYKLDVYLV